MVFEEIVEWLRKESLEIERMGSVRQWSGLVLAVGKVHPSMRIGIVKPV